MCAYRTDVETTEDFFLSCYFHSTQRLELFENFEKVKQNFLGLSVKSQVHIWLYGSQINNSKNLKQEIF